MHTQAPTATPVFVDVPYLSIVLNLTIGTIYNLASRGCLPIPSYKLGRQLRFKHSELMDWVGNMPAVVPVSTPKQPVEIKRGRGRPPKVALKNQNIGFGGAK